LEYIVEGNKKKICSENCQEDTGKKYRNSNTLSCHSSCEETSYKFNLNNECVESCVSPTPYHLYDTGTCVANCEGGYFLLRNESTCYNKPPNETEYKYFDVDNNEWNTCKNPSIPERPTYGEGYIYEDKCYKSCNDINLLSDLSDISEPKNYHRINDNKCIKDCESNDDIYKYSKNDGEEKDYICYSSCKDIPGNYIYEFEFNCYNSDISFLNTDNAGNSQYYFYEESGIYKYFKIDDNEELIKVCSSRGLYYLKENQCVKDCPSEEYRELFSTNENGKVISLGKCLGINACVQTEYPFISNNQKICFKECPYKIIDNPGGNEENCVIQCPNNYPYESDNGKKCISSCAHYIENEGKKICVSNCKDYSKFYFDGEKNVLTNV
jgi:hypothetical protein